MNKQLIMLGLFTTLFVATAFAFIHKPERKSESDESFLNNGVENGLDIPLLWEKYQKNFRLHFDDSEEEEKYRYSIFTKNILYISNNPQLNTTEYMHLTSQEFAEQTFGVIEQESTTYPKLQQVTLPISSIDWQTKGAVSPVKNQGLCAGSWAFSVTAGVESSLFLKNGKIPDLSEQFFLDCDTTNDACNGGDREKALQYVIEKGLNTQSVNPYKAYQSKCKYQEKQPFTISSYKQFNNCNDVLHALQDSPLVVAIDGSQLQFYKQGILQAEFKQRNFGALLVGYDSKQGYWKLKTSLNKKFGEQGYIRLYGAIKDGLIQNTAGICDRAFQVVA